MTKQFKHLLRSGERLHLVPRPWKNRGSSDASMRGSPLSCFKKQNHTP